MWHKLRKLLLLRVYGGSQQVVSGNRRPLGYTAYTLGHTTATPLTLPSTTTTLGSLPQAAIVQNQDTAIYVRWRDDGTAPTTTTGMRLPPGAELDYYGDTSAIQFIGESGTPVINVSLYA